MFLPFLEAGPSSILSPLTPSHSQELQYVLCMLTLIFICLIHALASQIRHILDYRMNGIYDPTCRFLGTTYRPVYTSIRQAIERQYSDEDWATRWSVFLHETLLK